VRVLRPLLIAALVALFVELQSQSSLDLWMLLAVFALSALLLHALRGKWSSLGPVALIFLLSSAVLPVGSDGHEASSQPTSASSALPPIVHLVLDEQIGVEGIPREFDADGEAARALRDLYLSRGFQVFGRAYSRHFLSRDSFSAMFNNGEATRYAGTSRRVFIARNYLFADLNQRGYAIRVLQTDYLDFCEVQRDFEIEMCRSFSLETPAVLDDAELDVGVRAELLVGMLLRLAPRLPAPEVGRVSPLAASATLEVAMDEIAALKPGVALFVHLMLPHFPYAYDSSCALRGDPRTWAYGEGAELAPDHYSAAGRALRYPLYLEQVGCAQQRVGELLDAIDANPAARGAWVVVQGDHGSRITTTRPSPSSARELSAADLSDGYSTLFAVRKPELEPRYDRRVLPIEALVPAALSQKALPSAASWAQPPYVVLADQGDRARRPLAEFDRRDALGDRRDALGTAVE
jgi:hypothetical protein